MYKTGHAACVAQQSQGRRRAARASDLRVVRTGPVYYEPRHRRVEASSVSLCRLCYTPVDYLDAHLLYSHHPLYDVIRAKPQRGEGGTVGR